MSVRKYIEGVVFVREWLDGKGMVTYWCPGCEQAHSIIYGPEGTETWTWNGDVNHPTFTPSVLSMSHEKLNEAGKDMVDSGRGSELTDEHRTRTPLCHSFVTDGKIQYLSDSEHELAGTTVDMVPLPERYHTFLEGDD